MTHLALAFGFIGAMYAISSALKYDLLALPTADCALTGPAAVLWKTNMAAWKVTRGMTK